MFTKIDFLVIDVDGTMTDSGIYYDNNGNELKKFCTRDAVGFFSAKKAGIKTIIITGRESEATKRRLSELKADYVFQNINNKSDFLKKFIDEKNIEPSHIGFIGDDLNDLEAMKITGFIACPSDSIKEIIDISDYVSPIKGGHGVVTDVVRHILNKLGIWNKTISNLYGGI